MGKKYVKITESELAQIVMRVLNEQEGSNEKDDLTKKLRDLMRFELPGKSAFNSLKEGDVYDYLNFLYDFNLEEIKNIGLSVNSSSRGSFSPHLGEPGNEEMMYKVWHNIVDDLFKILLYPKSALCENGIKRTSEIVAKKNSDMNNWYRNYPVVLSNLSQKQLQKIGSGEDKICS